MVGRFPQEDVYRGNNPVVYYDPSGYEQQECKDVLPGDGSEQKNNGNTTTPDFYVSPDGQAIPRVAYNLPEYDGSTTHGVLITSDGSEISFTSGGGDPRYTNYANNGHVEQKSSLYMRDNNISSGVLYHNNTEGTCGFCNTMTSTFLPEGATLTVVPPSNAVATNSKAIDVPKTYTGNSKDPKISSRYTGN